MTTATVQIAQHLNILESAIKEVQEWANVLFVKFVSGRPRFVSKKVVKTMEMTQKQLAEKIAQTVSGTYGFGQCKVWTGKPGECRVYLGKNGFVKVSDRVEIVKSYYAKEVTAMLKSAGLLDVQVSAPTQFTQSSNKCWRDEDGNPVDHIAHPAEACYFG